MATLTVAQIQALDATQIAQPSISAKSKSDIGANRRDVSTEQIAAIETADLMRLSTSAVKGIDHGSSRSAKHWAGGGIDICPVGKPFHCTNRQTGDGGVAKLSTAAIPVLRPRS